MSSVEPVKVELSRIFQTEPNIIFSLILIENDRLLLADRCLSQWPAIHSKHTAVRDPKSWPRLNVVNAR